MLLKKVSNFRELRTKYAELEDEYAQLQEDNVELSDVISALKNELASIPDDSTCGRAKLSGDSPFQQNLVGDIHLL